MGAPAGGAFLSQILLYWSNLLAPLCVTYLSTQNKTIFKKKSEKIQTLAEEKDQ